MIFTQTASNTLNMITNGLGIVRDIDFYDENYYLEHPEIQVSKKDDSPDENKPLADSKALLPKPTRFLSETPILHALFSNMDSFPQLLFVVILFSMFIAAFASATLLSYGVYGSLIF